MPFCWTAGFAFCKVGPKFFQDSSTFSWFIAASIGLAANTSCTMLWYLHWQWSCSSRDAKRGGENWTRKKPTLNLWKWSNLERKPRVILAHKKTLPILANHTSMQQHQQPKCPWSHCTNLFELSIPELSFHGVIFRCYTANSISIAVHKQAPTSLLRPLHVALIIPMRTTHCSLRERDYLLRAFNDPIAWAISSCHKKFRNFRHNQNQYLSAEI